MIRQVVLPAIEIHSESDKDLLYGRKINKNKINKTDEIQLNKHKNLSVE